MLVIYYRSEIRNRRNNEDDNNNVVILKIKTIKGRRIL